MYVYVCPKCRYTDVVEADDGKCMRCGTTYVPLGVSTREYNLLTEMQRDDLVVQTVENANATPEIETEDTTREYYEEVPDTGSYEAQNCETDAYEAVTDETIEYAEEVAVPETVVDDYEQVEDKPIEEKPKAKVVKKALPMRAKAVGASVPAKKSIAEKFDNIRNELVNDADDYDPGRPLKTNRSLLFYIIFNTLTLGIYGAYFLYKMAKDVNVACSGDGQKTRGLLAFILLSMITCGIYPLIWKYKLANRLAENSVRYGLYFQQNGTTILLWHIFGFCLCFIGPYIAMNILITNTNRICMLYNRENGLEG